MLYRIIDGSVSVGGKTVLSHIRFEVRGNEKLGIVGRNGAGKTTLLRVIAGELDLDRDDKRQGSGLEQNGKPIIGMLGQNGDFGSELTVEEFILEGCREHEEFSQERYSYETEYDKLFTGFGFSKSDKNRKLSVFSGGEQAKIRLIRLLLARPDILLLDEPTNHLDLKTTEWLEQYLKSYEKAVVVVSHDRFFMDRVVDAVYELSGGKLQRFAGNYTSYRRQKQKDLAAQKKAYERYQAEEQRLKGLIEKFKHKPRKAAFARSRRTILERMEQVERPGDDGPHIFTGAIEPEVLGSKWVVQTEKLKLGYEEALAELSLRIRRGQKIGMIGANGAGKTTFLKTIAGLVEPLGGKCELGNRIVAGYFDQQTAQLMSEESVIEHFKHCFPSLTNKEVRQVLGSYLFRGQDTGKRIRDLSGGEKARLVLCEILTGRPNLLLLDEPTNHMDIQAKETLESAFRAYTGTILFVSHDRYFIRQVADAVLVFEDDGVYYYPFGYEHYLEQTRHQRDGSPAAMFLAQEKAMLDGLHAVPKSERHETRQMTTEEAYVDWRLQLAMEPLEEAEQQVADIWKARDTLQEEQQMTDWEAELEAAWDRWTKACLDWYDATRDIL